MTESFVVHLQSGPLADGVLRGVVDVITTGERLTVTSIEELRELMVVQASRDNATASIGKQQGDQET